MNTKTKKLILLIGALFILIISITILEFVVFNDKEETREVEDIGNTSSIIIFKAIGFSFQKSAEQDSIMYFRKNEKNRAIWIINNAIENAEKINEMLDVREPDYLVAINGNSSKRHYWFLWLENNNNKDYRAFITTTDDASTGYNISLEDTKLLKDLFYYQATKNIKIEVIPSEEKKLKEMLLPQKECIECEHSRLFSYGLDEVRVIVNNKTFLIEEALMNGMISMDDIITELEYSNDMCSNVNKDMYLDGGSLYYTLYTQNFSFLKCNTIDGNKDYYIGQLNMGYQSNFCK